MRPCCRGAILALAERGSAVDQWAELALSLQQDVAGELSRLSIATVIAEVRRDLRMTGEAESLSSVDAVATLRVADLVARRRRTTGTR
jgi:hypothetical protein